MSVIAEDELAKKRLDLQLDKELEDTFPASDALKITRRPSDRRTRPEDADADATPTPKSVRARQPDPKDI